MLTFTSSLSIIFILNIFLAIAVIFFERKTPSTAWAWIMVLLLIPGLGFVLYLLFNQNFTKRKMFQIGEEEREGINALRNLELEEIQKDNYIIGEDMVEYKEIIRMNLAYDSEPFLFTPDNNVEIFVDGNEKFDDLIKEIQSATSYVHILYYIIKNDDLSVRLFEALMERARSGVEVRMLYDAVGGRSIKRKTLKELHLAGVKTGSFFPSSIPLVNFKLNYRNHRKIAVIDNKVSYIGGFNVGDEYLGLDKKFGYWRDTHLKITGNAVNLIQTRFMLDWIQATGEVLLNMDKYLEYIDEKKGDAGVQIVFSGPDDELEQIKYGYIKMINSAKRSVYLQTPYFIPDNSLLEALKLAALSGIDVRIMIPCKPDHMFVYWASYSYVGELIKYGVKVYTYDNGFLHAKTLVIDGMVASVGTANIDIRSFKLNFEVNAFVFDKDTSTKLKEIYLNDVEKYCSILDEERYSKRGSIIKIKEAVSRLLSPIL